LKGPSEQLGECAPLAAESNRVGTFSFGAADLYVAILCAVSIFSFTGSREIQGVRERRIAGPAADIVRNGNWLLPSLRGEPRFRKPLLANWAAAASVRMFGRNEWAFRLPFALCGLGTVAVSYLIALKLMGLIVARITALILASSVVFCLECHLASTDLLLTLFCAAAMLIWIHWRTSARSSARWWWCFYLSLSLAVLSTKVRLLCCLLRYRSASRRGRPAIGHYCVACGCCPGGSWR
jgi:4-amino-4-deoxy-L-arabinose transferase-like glycosyltransferase